MSGKGMQEAGREGWEGERAVRHNGTAAFINLWISGREERTERWMPKREGSAPWASKGQGLTASPTQGDKHSLVV